MNDIYVVIPTYQEAENIKKIIPEIISLNNNLHIIVVDDNSPDGTAEVVRSLDKTYGNITVLLRPGKMGIGSAIRDGMKEALAFQDCKFIITMDADLSHDPAAIPGLLGEACKVDLVQGSRYIKGGKVVGWSWQRKLISRAANFLYKHIFSLKQSEITTYFRVYSRKCAELVVSHSKANKYEFAIESALIVNDYDLSVAEVPIKFVNRVEGRSKLKIADIIDSIRYLAAIYILRLVSKAAFHRIIKFSIVGATGICVNQGLLWLFTDKFGMYYMYSALVGIEASIISNFILNDLWTFRDMKRAAGNMGMRFLKYNLLCIAGAIFNYIVLWTFTDILHVYYLISNLFGIVAAFIWNYFMSLKWAWARQ